MKKKNGGTDITISIVTDTMTIAILDANANIASVTRVSGRANAQSIDHAQPLQRQ
jgi:hypothetical protein